MNPTIPCIYPLAAILAAFSFYSPLQAGALLNPLAEDSQKIEITTSMTGFRDTLRFYVFEEAKAVLRVRIGNENTDFPVSAKLYVFAEDTTAEGLAKWVNNQHSDGLYADAAEPTATHEIPAAACKVKSHEIGEVVEEPWGKFSRFSVVFEIKDVPALGEIKIKDFTDTGSVHVKVQAN